jgi:hypothetical protein
MHGKTVKIPDWNLCPEISRSLGFTTRIIFLFDVVWDMNLKASLNCVMYGMQSKECRITRPKLRNKKRQKYFLIVFVFTALQHYIFPHTYYIVTSIVL